MVGIKENIDNRQTDSGNKKECQRKWIYHSRFTEGYVGLTGMQSEEKRT